MNVFQLDRSAKDIRSQLALSCVFRTNLSTSDQAKLQTDVHILSYRAERMTCHITTDMLTGRVASHADGSDGTTSELKQVPPTRCWVE